MNQNFKLIGSGNQEGRSFFIFNKDSSFFARFSLFLIGCGFRELGVYEDYAQEIPQLEEMNHYIDNIKNEEYDIDIILTQDRIILIIRHDLKFREKLVSGIKRMIKK